MDLMRLFIGSFARHFLTGLAGTLVTLGWIGADQKSNFVTIGAGIAIGASGMAMSWWQKVGHAKLAATMHRGK